MVNGKEVYGMIRGLLEADIDAVADIWLDTNLRAHYYVPSEYWKGNYELVKGLLVQATVYVYEVNGKILGFVGLNDEFIEGIFVSDENQSQGIGGKLLAYVKEGRNRLKLSVYKKNVGAISFYEREGFEVRCTGLDEGTGEEEYLMVWDSL